MNQTLMTIDVAHPPLHPERVEAVLDEALAEVRTGDGARVLKIIHGYGSTAAGGRTRTTVRNWAYRMRERVREVIDGERYGLSDPATQRLRLEAGTFPDPDLDRSNPGITILWVK